MTRYGKRRSNRDSFYFCRALFAAIAIVGLTVTESQVSRLFGRKKKKKRYHNNKLQIDPAATRARAILTKRT